MLNVFCACFAFDDYVINIHFHYLAYQQLKNFHHQPLVCCSYILEPKKHDVVAVQSLRCDESRFLFIQLEHGDVVVLGKGIKEGKHFMSGR